MSVLDLYDRSQSASPQPGEGTRLPSGFEENAKAAWSDGLLFSQSTARDNARAAVLQDYVTEIRQKTGQDVSRELDPDANSGSIGPDMFAQANARVAAMKADYPDLDLAPLDEDEIDRRAVAKAQAAHRDYQALQAGEKGPGGSIGSFLGSAGASAADPMNILALGVAPEAAGIGILSTALRWGALAGVSQAAIEAASDTFKEQVQPGYMESGAPLQEIGGAFVGGAVLGGGIKALGSAWTRVKTGSWPTSVRDAGNVIESEANVAQTNIFPGAEGEVAHREALIKTIDDILAGRPVDVGAQITPEMQAAAEAERAKAMPAPEPGMPAEQLPLDFEAPAPKPKAVEEGPAPALQTAEDMQKTLAAPDHQDAIRADIDRARMTGDVQVPGIDENGNHTMLSVDKAMDQVDAYKAAAEHIQACANPPAEEEAA